MPKHDLDEREITRSEATLGSTAALIFAIALIAMFFAVCGWLIYVVRGGDAGRVYESGKDAVTNVYEKGKDAVTSKDPSSNK